MNGWNVATLVRNKISLYNSSAPATSHGESCYGARNRGQHGEEPCCPTIKCARMSDEQKRGRARVLTDAGEAPTNHGADYPKRRRRAKEGDLISSTTRCERRRTTLAIALSFTMLRQHFVRSLKRPALRAALNGSRAFTASARRTAEIELTIGLCHCPLPPRMSANELRRWK